MGRVSEELGHKNVKYRAKYYKFQLNSFYFWLKVAKWDSRECQNCALVTYSNHSSGNKVFSWKGLKG